MPSQPHDQNFELIDELAPEFSADDPLERRLLEDGARWRARITPPIEPFAQRMNAALRASGRGPTDSPVEERPMTQRIVTQPPLTSTSQPRRRPGNWNTLVAVAAAVAIVATLAWVFQTIPHTRVAGKTVTPAPNPAAHVTHPRGHWEDVVQYTLSTSGSVYVAPSDPRVAYRAISSQSSPTVTALARTTDGGATWTPLTLPSDYGGWFGSLAISPLDPQTVFITLYADRNNSHCPAYALPSGADVGPAALNGAPGPHADARLGPLHPTSGGYACYFQYVSRDGGASWTHPRFPWKAYHFADAGPNLTTIQAQGATLVAAVAGDLNGPAYLGVRIAASSDGGSTWEVADADIYATGQIVESYAVLPSTSTLYALSVPQQTESGRVSSAAVWRSDDGGAHWTQVGTSPLAEARLVAVARTPGGRTLYEVRLGSAPDSKRPVYFSRDDGRTWSPVSTAGWPTAQGDNPWTISTLADGSLMMEFNDLPTPNAGGVILLNANVSFYAWRPGDARWFQVAPRPGSGSAFQSWITWPANGPQTLWLVVGEQQGTIFTVRKCVLE